MRICISSLELDSFGGAERVVLSDAERFADDGNEVHIISDVFDQEVLAEYGLDDSVNCHQYSVGRPYFVPEVFRRAWSIRNLLKKINPDTVIAHYREKATWFALLSLPIDSAFITHIHGTVLWFENNPNRIAHLRKDCLQSIIDDVPGHSEFWDRDDFSRRQQFKSSIAELFEAMALRSCDEIFVNTHQIAHELGCLYDVEVNVNPPGIDLDENVQRNTDIPPDEPYIFSLSRLDSRKRIDLLIRSFSELKEKKPNINLVVGGTGNEEDTLKQLVKQEDIEDSVVFPGFIEEDLITNYYSKAEIFACPGWMSYGLTPLEAVRANTKVALSADAFVNELIGDEKGVRVLSPDVETWVSGLEELLECQSAPSSKAVPTVESHTRKKLDKIYKYDGSI